MKRLMMITTLILAATTSSALANDASDHARLRTPSATTNLISQDALEGLFSLGWLRHIPAATLTLITERK
ncbi:MAG: hypothetical protein U1D06_11245 [Paracoccaceae bacterium]|nr:hypothetical protein [Paracoccaceae bacterium]